jgi:hypothetical protein
LLFTLYIYIYIYFMYKVLVLDFYISNVDYLYIILVAIVFLICLGSTIKAQS